MAVILSLCIGVYAAVWGYRNSESRLVLPDAIIADLHNITGLESSTLLRLYNHYGDINAIVRKAPIYLAISTRMTEMGFEKRFVVEAIEQGIEPLNILTAVEYLLSKSIPLSELKGMLEQRSTGLSWDKILDPVRTKYGIAEAAPLSKEEIREYFSKGLTPEDITEAVGLSEATGTETRFLLTSRAEGKTWDELQTAYDPGGIWRARKNTGCGDEEQRLLQNGYHLTDIRLAQLYGRAMGIDTESVLLDMRPDMPVQQIVINKNQKLKEEKEKSKLEEIKSTYGVEQATLENWSGRGLNPYEIENALRLSKENGLDANEIVNNRLSGAAWQDILGNLTKGGEGVQ